MIDYLLIIAPSTGSGLISICEILTGHLFPRIYAVDGDQRWSAFFVYT